MDEKEHFLSGARVSREELFDNVVSLAGIVQDLANQAAVQHEEITHVLKEVRGATAEAREQIVYAVEQLKARASQEVRVKKDMLHQWIGIAAAQLLVTAAMLGLIAWWIPSLEEVQQRRKEIANMRAETSLLASAIKRGDETWIPSIDSLTTCAPPGSQNCVTFARIQ